MIGKSRTTLVSTYSQRLLTLGALLPLALVALSLGDSAQANHQPTFLEIEPESDSRLNGTSHRLAASFRDEANAPIELSEEQLIDFEIMSGPNADSTPNARDFECPSNGATQGANCNAQYLDAQPFDPNNTVDHICAWISTDGDDDQYDPNGTAADGGDCDAELPGETDWTDLTDSVLMTWIGSTPTFLDIEPESDTSPANTRQEFAASFTDQFGRPAGLSEAHLVDAEIISGPNANQTPNFRDFECPSPAPTEGDCVAGYDDGASFDTTNPADVICFWLSTDGDDDQYDPNGTAADGGDCDVEAPDESEAGTDFFGRPIPGDKGNDTTDKVMASWIVQQLSHDRTIGIKLGHKGGDLVVSGTLDVTDDYLGCLASQPVKVQRRTGGKWDTKATRSTDAQGDYRAELADKPGRYRAVASKTAHADPDPSKHHTCSGAKKERVHKH